MFIKVSHAWHFAGPQVLPDRFKHEGPYLLSIGDITDLTRDYSVMFHRDRHGGLSMGLDDYNKRFQSR